MEIISGFIYGPQKTLIYGIEGIGKSTLASQFPNPLFFDLENRTAHLNVQRVKPASWDRFMSFLDDLRRDAMGFRTIVVDTADWAEQLARKDVLEKARVTSIKTVGDYGLGYLQIYERMKTMVDKLDAIMARQECHVLLLAHARISRFVDPAVGASYDRYCLKLQDSDKSNVQAFIKEWVDHVLFLNYATTAVVDKKDKTTHAKGGNNRTIYVEHSAGFDAKNSWHLHDEFPMEYAALKPYIEREPSPVAPVSQQATPAPVANTTTTTTTPAPATDDIERKKNLQQQAIDFAAQFLGINHTVEDARAYVKERLTANGLTFKTMTIGECELFVQEIQTEATAAVRAREENKSHAA